MRIGVIGPLLPDHFADNICDALERAGHLVTPLGPAGTGHERWLANRVATLSRQALPGLDERLLRRLVRAALEAECEVVINVDVRLTPAAVAALKRNGVRVALWFPDAVSQLGRELMLVSPYDALFFKEPHVVDRLRACLGLPAYYLPEACNPRWHRPLVQAGTQRHLVTAASMRPSRVRLVERLMAKGIPVRLYGGAIPRWLPDGPIGQVHAGHELRREEKARVFRAAAGVLNTLALPEVTGVNARLFEAAGCGAAVLTEFRPALPGLFEIGSEVLAFRDFDELVDQAARVLEEADLTERLGDAAARRAHRDHTYEKRLAVILEKIS